MIVAVLIVKNESHVLGRCVKSLLPHVDGIYILDTGSDSNEFEVMRAQLNMQCSGVLRACIELSDWKGFAESRNEAMQRAIEGFELRPEDWLFMIDADDYVEAWEKPRDDWYTGYHVTMMGEGCIYPRVQLFQVMGQWRYVGVIHEFPEAGSVGHVGTLKTIVRSTREGARNRDPEKYLNDAKLINDEFIRGVDDELLKRRYMFYLAQSYRDAGVIDEALNCYNERAKMGGYADEVYVSYLEGMRLLVTRDGFNETDQLVYMMLQAQGACPHRRECVWQMMRWYREAETWEAVTNLYNAYPPVEAPREGLFVELRAYDYGMHDEAGVAYYWLGDYAASLKASLTALSVYPDLHGDIKRIIANLGHAQRKL